MKKKPKESIPRAPRRIAVVGAGMAGVTCARTLMQAGHNVVVFEKLAHAGGRMATHVTPFGSFDSGAQYFTIRDPRFAQALETVPRLCRPWSANAVRVLDAVGHVAEAALPTHEPHWAPTPGMDALVRAWAAPIARDAEFITQTRIQRIERDALSPKQWQLRAEGPGDGQHVHSGFDDVVLALPSVHAHELLLVSGLLPALTKRLAAVEVAPCWTLMLAFPQAMQPSLNYLGPQWNAARSTHHRAAWLARESSKPQRGSVERWTLQASPSWSTEHLEDDPQRAQAKLMRAFAEITGIRAEPAYASVIRWRTAQTVKPLGESFAWDNSTRIGVCGDWCLGHRVENAFVSGLELALKML